MNCYARVPDLRRDLNSTGYSGGDSALADALGEATRQMQTATGGRQFHTTTETRYFTPTSATQLWVGDLLTITTLKFDEDGDGTYEITLTTDDYWLWPDNPQSGFGYRRIDLNPNGDNTAFTLARRSVQIVGTWGQSEFLEPVIGTAAVTATVGTTSGLTFTTSETCETNDIVALGDTLVIGTEQVGDVLSVTPAGFTVRARGVNGTTAATHSGVALYLRRYPADIERAVRADAARYLWRMSQGVAEGSFREMWPAIAMCANSYLDPASVI